MKLSDIAQTILRKRYLKKDKNGRPIENPEGMLKRVARAIALAEKQFGNNDAEVEKWEKVFFEMMDSLDFLPNSPTLMNSGRELGMLSACFLLPVGDSMEEIFDAVKNASLIQKAGGGTGFNFSRLRPRGSIVGSTKGVSSGPVSFMEVFSAATETVKQGGTRRGANLGLLRCDHPDIREFITCKDETGKLNNFNISVAITDKFMKAVEKDGELELVAPHTNEVVKKVKAKPLFHQIVRQAHKNGEPGLFFIDEVNRNNPTPHVGEIEGVNPCGELPLIPNESCNLGSINLSRFIKDGKVEYERLKTTVHCAVRFLDNVIEVNRYPLKVIEEMTKSNRKIGLGVMGWADLLIELGIPYNSEEAVGLAGEVMGFVQAEAWAASERLAAHRGEFPNFVGSKFDGKDGRHVRNATVTTIAPTGTLSIIAGASGGIEPVYALVLERKQADEDMVDIHPLFDKVSKDTEWGRNKEVMERIFAEGSLQNIEQIPEDIKEVYVCTHDIEFEWHVRMQAAFQKHVDNAVSKTVNLPAIATVRDVEKAFLLAYKLGCKGLTIYRDGSREEQVLSKKRQEKEEEEKPIRGYRARPKVTRGITEKVKTGCGACLVTRNVDDDGPCEVIIESGKAGGCVSSWAQALGRIFSLALRAGVEENELIKQLRGLRCSASAWDTGIMVLSCADAVGIVLSRYADKNGNGPAPEEKKPESKAREACPECGYPMIFQESCSKCTVCGFSRCL